MKDMVDDLVRRMGASGEVARICADAVDALSGGDVCRSVDEKEAAELASAPDVVATPGARDAHVAESAPFVLYGGLLYTRRNWVYENRIVSWVQRAAAAPSESGDVRELPDTSFYRSLREEQRQAALSMCARRFSILTGGPGTGKTHTIARAVRFMKDRNPVLRLALAAPTGKAAARMMESLHNALKGEEGGIDVPAATTLHGLLRPNYDLVSFRCNAQNPLDVDWLIVDEASMIGLPMMAKLLDALPDGCRLTLVGDVDQLASVERGRVFGDLCRMPGVVVSRLDESARFPPGGEIATFAAAVNGNRPDAAMAALNAGGGLVSYVDLSLHPPFSPAAWPGFARLVKDGFAALASSRTADEALARVNDFRILCALREGPYGMRRMNEFVKKALGGKCPVPVMVTKNEKALNVWNGDVGVVMPDDGQCIHLPSESGTRRLRLELLPAFETAFASTIHKAQGSEYRDVAIVMPPDGESPLLTREILYTGITRTRRSVHLHSGEAAVRRCCGHTVERVSGLLENSGSLPVF